jgi:hypothetical protein
MKYQIEIPISDSVKSHHDFTKGYREWQRIWDLDKYIDFAFQYVICIKTAELVPRFKTLKR